MTDTDGAVPLRDADQDSSFLPDIVRSLLRAREASGWTVASEEFWCRVSPERHRALPAQGWKLHVSATPLSAPLVLRRCAEVLIADRAAFKFAGTLDRVAELIGGRYERAGGGKFVTVYPQDDGTAAWWPVSESGGVASVQPPHWCSGSSGVGTFLIRLWRATGSPDYRALAEQGAVEVYRRRLQAGPCPTPSPCRPALSRTEPRRRPPSAARSPGPAGSTESAAPHDRWEEVKHMATDMTADVTALQALESEQSDQPFDVLICRVISCWLYSYG